MEAMNGKTVHEQTPTMAQREAMRRRPKRGPVMYQRWYDLLFLHWAWDAAEIQATLPAGLTVDTFDGQAWLGVVPFAMSGVRPRGLPAVGGLSAFLELNLRTYVHAADGTPGVWFYSLDCEQRLAVMIARTLFGLPYRHARMARRGGVEEAAGGNRVFFAPGRSRGWRGESVHLSGGGGICAGAGGVAGVVVGGAVCVVQLSGAGERVAHGAGVACALPGCGGGSGAG